MENLFYFNKKSEALRFANECRKYSILIEPVSDYVSRICAFDALVDKEGAMRTAKRVYSQIMG